MPHYRYEQNQDALNPLKQLKNENITKLNQENCQDYLSNLPDDNDQCELCGLPFESHDANLNLELNV